MDIQSLREEEIQHNTIWLGKLLQLATDETLEYTLWSYESHCTVRSIFRGNWKKKWYTSPRIHGGPNQDNRVSVQDVYLVLETVTSMFGPDIGWSLVLTTGQGNKLTTIGRIDANGLFVHNQMAWLRENWKDPAVRTQACNRVRYLKKRWVVLSQFWQKHDFAHKMIEELNNFEKQLYEMQQSTNSNNNNNVAFTNQHPSCS